MALTSAFDKICQEISFTSATNPVTVADATRLTKITPGAHVGSASNQAGDQFITVYATHSVAAGTATLVFFLADNDSVGSLGAGKIAQDSCVITGLNSTRQSHSTAAGDYVASVVFGISGGRTLDLHKFGKDWPRWYVGCQAISGGTVTIRVVAGRPI